MGNDSRVDYDTTKLSAETTIGKKIGLVERLGFGCGDLAVNFVWASMGMFIVYFYTDVAGIAAGVVGTIMIITRVCDGIADVTMGVIVDRTKSKYGKARPWILRMCVPFSIMTVIIFAVPNIGHTGKAIYAFVTYYILNLVFSAIVIPYGTLNSLITQDQYERSVLNIFRMFLAQVGVIIVSNLTLPLVKSFGGEQSAWVATYTIFAIVAVILFLIVFKTTKERVGVADDKKARTDKLPLKVSIKALLKNKYWAMVFAFFIVYSMGTALWQGSTIYYAQYMLNNKALTGILTMAITVPILIGFLFMPPLFKRFGKRNTVLIGSFISIIGTLIIMSDVRNIYFVIIGAVVRGIGKCPLTGALWAFLPDTIEYGEWKTGIRNEGLIYSAGSMGQKIGVGLGGALLGWILAWGGYHGGATVQSTSAIFAINCLFLYLPLVTYVLQAALLLFYKLDKIYPQIEKDLLEKNR